MKPNNPTQNLLCLLVLAVIVAAGVAEALIT